MADFELVALDTATPELQAITASDTGVIPGSLKTQLGTNLAFTSGNVVIGALAHASADGKFQVLSGSAGAVTAHASYNEITAEGSGDTGFSTLAPDTNKSGWAMGSPGNQRGAYGDWGLDDLLLRISTNVVASSLIFSSDASVLNITLAGASGSITTKLSGFLLKSATDSITCGTTQTQSGATALTTDINRITVCANVADVSGLPSARVGASCKIIHDGVNNAGIFPKISGDKIDGGAADAVDANALVAGTTRTYDCLTAGTWETAS